MKGTQPTPLPYSEGHATTMAAETLEVYMSKEQLQKAIQQAKKNMEKAVKEMDFLSAAKYRDEMIALQENFRRKDS